SKLSRRSPSGGYEMLIFPRQPIKLGSAAQLERGREGLGRRGRNIGMLQVKIGRVLVGLGHRQQPGFAKKVGKKCKAERSTGTAGLQFRVRTAAFGSIVAAKAVRQNHRRMAGEI